MSPIRVVIAGATGDLGRRVVRQLISLEYYPSQVSEVKFFTRNPTSGAVRELLNLGAKQITGTINKESFESVDVFVSVLGEGTTLEDRNAYVQAAVDAGVKVYIPTEFGIDHREMPFKYPIWELKTAHDQYARNVRGEGLKVVSIFVGLFLDDTFSVGPALGFDTLSRVYTGVVSPDVQVSFLSRDDIAASVARIAVLAAADPTSVPDYTRINGSSASYREIAELVSQVRGERITVRTMENDEVDTRIKNGDFWIALRSAMGHGRTDFSHYNVNEIINPGESLWKWKTIQEYIEETKGVAPQNKQLLRE